MKSIEHPFTKAYRAVLKEKYLDKEAAIPDNASLTTDTIREDVISEALKRYYTDKKLIIGPRIWVSPTNTVQKQKIQRTITYV
jgi:hypothetical protein